jgi:predicted ATPase with chaperone activity
MTATMTAPAAGSSANPAQTPAPAPESPAPFIPPVPKNLAEAGLNPGMVESLALKHLLNTGSASGGDIANALCLPNAPVIELLQGLKQQQIITYVGSAGASDFNYQLSDAGRDRARRMMEESMYTGAAPVPLPQYVGSIRAQTITTKTPNREDLTRAFSDLLINQQMFDTLGPAINSGRGMFLYGYPGNGKTSIAERITKCFGDEIYIPRVLSCDGTIIKLFDPENHEAIEVKRDSIFKSDNFDARWVKIKRPTIIVGGELTMDGLEVQYNATTKVCEAPLQLKSNCGTFVIDDFGRQRMEPIELLNRWIVPLEKRYDFLSLPNGKKMQVPFDQLIIFSTNLEPKDLVDDAFLRRIPYKINVGDPSEDEFRKLFEIFAPKMGFEHRPDCIDYLIDKHYRGSRPFRCCQPRDLLLQVRNHCLYQGKRLELTKDYFDFAASVYFTVM